MNEGMLNVDLPVGCTGRGEAALLHLFCTVPVNVCVGAGVLSKSL